MTVEAVASIFGAKGRGPNYRARCPVHKSRGLTLSIREHKDGEWVQINCFAGCDRSDILKVVGLRVRDLALKPLNKYDAKEAHIRTKRVSLREAKERLDIALGAALMLQVVDNKPRYWEAAERRLRGELNQVRYQLEPEMVIAEAYSKLMARWAEENPVAEAWAAERVRQSLLTRNWNIT